MTQTTETREARPGFVGHVTLSSDDVQATKEFCQTVLDWDFDDTIETPAGPYLPWSNIHRTGGGIQPRAEGGGNVPYVEVPDLRIAIDKAEQNGATVVSGPDTIPDGSRIALLNAPGDVAIGLWAPQ